jgi:hypothetical protein
MVLLTELGQHVTSKMIVNQLMKTHVSVVASFTPKIPESLQTLHCRRNKPLFVFPYGEQMNRNSLSQVRPKTSWNFKTE